MLSDDTTLGVVFITTLACRENSKLKLKSFYLSI